MSSKVKKSAESKRRLYPKKSDVTPTEKRSSSNSQNQKTKSIGRNLSKDQKRPMTKQELIRQHVDLLDELQRLKNELEIAQKANKKLKKDLTKLKNSDQTNPNMSNHRNYSSKYSDQAEESNFSDDQDYNYNQLEEEEEERVNIPFDGYEEDEEDRFSSGSI